MRLQEMQVQQGLGCQEATYLHYLILRFLTYLILNCFVVLFHMKLHVLFLILNLWNMTILQIRTSSLHLSKVISNYFMHILKLLDAKRNWFPALKKNFKETVLMFFFFVFFKWGCLESIVNVQSFISDL